jgi:hypothetical protein
MAIPIMKAQDAIDICIPQYKLLGISVISFVRLDIFLYASAMFYTRHRIT